MKNTRQPTRSVTSSNTMKNSFFSPRRAIARLSSAVLLSVATFCGLAHADYTEDWGGRIYRDKYAIVNNQYNSNDAGGQSYVQAIYDWTRPDGYFSWGTKWKWPWGTGAIKSYPAACQGWSGGRWIGPTLPIKVSERKNISSSWHFKLNSDGNQPATGGFNIAYDLWFYASPPTDPNTFNPTDELMIWLYRQDQGAYGTKMEEVTLSGITWELYKGVIGIWNYYAFVPKENRTSVDGLDIRALIDHVTYTRGWMSDQRYLSAIEAGVEIKYSDTSKFNYFTSEYYRTDIW